MDFHVDVSKVESQCSDRYTREDKEWDKNYDDAHVGDHLDCGVRQIHGGVSYGTVHDAYVLRTSGNDPRDRSLI